MVQRVFIALEIFLFCWNGKPKQSFFIAIIKNKYFLYNIKRKINVYCIILIKNKYLL